MRDVQMKTYKDFNHMFVANSGVKSNVPVFNIVPDAIYQIQDSVVAAVVDEIQDSYVDAYFSGSDDDELNEMIQDSFYDKFGDKVYDATRIGPNCFDILQRLGVVEWESDAHNIYDLAYEVLVDYLDNDDEVADFTSETIEKIKNTLDQEVGYVKYDRQRERDYELEHAGHSNIVVDPRKRR